MKIIILKGRKGSGKSKTLELVYEKLKEFGYLDVEIDRTQLDMEKINHILILEKETVFLLKESNEPSDIKANILSCQKAGCKVCVLSCRSSIISKVINSITEYKYEIYQKTEDLPDSVTANAFDANVILVNTISSRDNISEHETIIMPNKLEKSRKTWNWNLWK